MSSLPGTCPSCPPGPIDDRYLCVQPYPMIHPRSNSLDDDSGNSSAGMDPTGFGLHDMPVNSDRLHPHRNVTASKYVAGNSQTDRNARFRDRLVHNVPVSTDQNELDIELPTRMSSSSWCRLRPLKAICDGGRSKPKKASHSAIGRSLSYSPGCITAGSTDSTFSTCANRSSEDFSTSVPSRTVGDAVPPLPPRDYPLRRAVPIPLPSRSVSPAAVSAVVSSSIPQSHRPEIHPIMKDGRKESDTHYFFLEDKQPRGASAASSSYSREDYRNISTKDNDSTTLWHDDSYKRASVVRHSEDKLQKILARTGLACCVGNDRRLIRSRSDSERRLLSESVESGIDIADQSSVNSASFCIEADVGQINFGLTEPHEDELDETWCQPESRQYDFNLNRKPYQETIEHCKCCLARRQTNHEQARRNQRLQDDDAVAKQGSLLSSNILSNITGLSSQINQMDITSNGSSTQDCPNVNSSVKNGTDCSVTTCDCASAYAKSEMLESLASLQVATKDECRRVLEACHWKVERAALCLLDFKCSTV